MLKASVFLRYLTKSLGLYFHKDNICYPNIRITNKDNTQSIHFGTYEQRYPVSACGRFDVLEWKILYAH